MRLPGSRGGLNVAACCCTARAVPSTFPDTCSPSFVLSNRPCPLLVPSGTAKVGPGQTAYINDSMGLHAVRCDEDACGEEEGAVSLVRHWLQAGWAAGQGSGSMRCACKPQACDP